MRAAFYASILPRVMKEGESKEGSFHFDENSQFDRTLQQELDNNSICECGAEEQVFDKFNETCSKAFANLAEKMKEQVTKSFCRVFCRVTVFSFKCQIFILLSRVG